MAKQKGNTITRQDGDACQREMCGGKLKQRQDGLMECLQCGYTYNRLFNVGTPERAATPPIIIPDALIMASAKAHHAMMIEVADRIAPMPAGHPEERTDPEEQWAGLSAHVRQQHYDEAKNVLERWWPEIVAHFAKGSATTDVLDLASKQAQNSRAAEELRALLTEIAIPSLEYCEEKFGHDDQARLNLEAAIGMKS